MDGFEYKSPVYKEIILIKRSFIVLFALAGTYSFAAQAQSLTSTYFETQECRTIEEGGDKFTLRCTAPSGNVSAILSYWDGRAFVVYEPFFSKKLIKAHIRDISNAASRVFGQKLEWRQRAGEKQPCAAIIRVYSTKGGILVVNDMATGKHLGDAKTNEQARKLADKACLVKSKDKIVAQKVDKTVPVEVLTAHASRNVSVAVTETNQQAIKRAEVKFKDLYFENGILGIIDEIKTCYEQLTQESGLSELSYCAALDIIAGNIDTMMTQGHPGLAQSYFDRGLETDKRIDGAFERLNFDTHQRAQFDQDITLALDVTLDDDAFEVDESQNKNINNIEPDVNKDLSKKESVFDFD